MTTDVRSELSRAPCGWRFLFSAALILCLGTSLPAAAAQTLFEQGPALAGAGVASQGSQQAADDFQLAVAATLESIAFSGIQTTDIFDSVFDLTIYADDAGLPSATVVVAFTGVVVSRTPTAEPTEFTYEFELPAPVALAAATRYHLSIFYAVDELGPMGETSDFSWQFVNDSGVSSFRLLPDDPWANDVGDLAFRLVGTPTPTAVPEATTLATLSLGLLLGSTRRTRR